MFGGVIGASLLNAWQAGLAFCTLALAILEESLGWFEWLSTGPRWAPALALASMLVIVELFSVPDSIPFVYFQF